MQPSFTFRINKAEEKIMKMKWKKEKKSKVDRYLENLEKEEKAGKVSAEEKMRWETSLDGTKLYFSDTASIDITASTSIGSFDVIANGPIIRIPDNPSVDPVDHTLEENIKLEHSVPKPEVGTETLAEYGELVEKLGIKNSPIRFQTLLEICHRLEIPTYDNDRVGHYLYKLATAKGMGHLVKWVNIQDYQKAIPVEGLRIAEKIQAEAPFELDFQVSDIMYEPDPFLRVSPEGSHQSLIIFKWDEPGFTLVDPKK